MQKNLFINKEASMTRGSISYYVFDWIRLYFGAHLLFSGLRYAISGYFAPTIPGIGGEWLQASVDIQLYHFVKYLQILTGAMLLFNRFTLLALIVEFPISVSIFWFNTIVVATPRQLFTGPQELFLNGVLLLIYSGWLYAVIKPRLEPLCLWNGAKVYTSDLQKGYAEK
jgi:hypothetical protein